MRRKTSKLLWTMACQMAGPRDGIDVIRRSYAHLRMQWARMTHDERAYWRGLYDTSEKARLLRVKHSMEE